RAPAWAHRAPLRARPCPPGRRPRGAVSAAHRGVLAGGHAGRHHEAAAVRPAAAGAHPGGGVWRPPPRAVRGPARPAASGVWGARGYGEMGGYGSVPVETGDEAGAAAEAIAEAMRRALTAAGSHTDEVDWVAAGAGSSPSGDRGEAMALGRLFAAEPDRLRTS